MVRFQGIADVALRPHPRVAILWHRQPSRRDGPGVAHRSNLRLGLRLASRAALEKGDLVLLSLGLRVGDRLRLSGDGVEHGCIHCRIRDGDGPSGSHERSRLGLGAGRDDDPEAVLVVKATQYGLLAPIMPITTVPAQGQNGTLRAAITWTTTTERVRGVFLRTSDATVRDDQTALGGSVSLEVTSVTSNEVHIFYLGNPDASVALDINYEITFTPSS